MVGKSNGISRRSFFKKSSVATAAVAAGSLVTNADLDSISAQVNTNSSPTDLKITDMRLARFGNWQQYVLRLDTNQGAVFRKMFAQAGNINQVQQANFMGTAFTGAKKIVHGITIKSLNCACRLI